MEGKQFSTSRGVVIHVGDFLSRYDPDPLRYFLTAAGPETQDTDFTWAEFVRRNNDELLANWGNLVNRTLTSAYRNFGAVPEPGELTDADRAVLEAIEAGFDTVGELIERARFKAALAETMRLASLLNQYVSDEAPWATIKTDRDRAATVLYVVLRGIDSLKILFTPFLPFTSQTLHELLGYDDVIAGPLRVPGGRRGGRRDATPSSPATTQSWAGRWQPSELEPGRALREPKPLFAKLDPSRSSRTSSRGWSAAAAARVIDTHAHLDALEEPDEAVARAREAGVTRDHHDRHRDRLVPARRSRSRSVTTASTPPSASIRTRRRTDEAGRLDELRELLAPPKSGRGRRDRPRLPLRRRPARRAAPPLRGAARARGRAGTAGRDPHARRRRGHRGAARGHPGHRRPALLLGAGPARRRARARLVRLVRRQRHLPEGGRAPRGRRGASPPTGSSPRPTARTSRRSPSAAERNEPANVVHTVAALAAGPRRGRRRARRADRRQRDGRLPAAVTRQAEEGARPALPRRREHPRRHRSARRARAGRRRARDRPGPRRAHARYLADRVGHVHAVELDRSLEPHLAELPPNVQLHWGDALALDLAALEPPPTKLVANLPYNVATPIVVESLDGLPTVGLWCVMVQREVADRFFASPSTKAYGAVSVLVQLATERTGFHPVSRTVFRPPPNVDSALVAFRRTTLPPRLRPRQAGRRGGVRAPAQDAAELARARRRRLARARASRRSRRSAARRRRAPRSSRRRSSSARRRAGG